jgi:hypothetical protein
MAYYEEEDTQPQPKPAPSSARRRQLRSLFWPGFVAGFMLLSGLTCGGLVLAAGFDRLDLADIQGSSVSWTPPSVTATPTQPPIAAGESDVTQETPPGFRIGDRLRNVTTTRVNIRRVPGYLGKPTDDVIGQIGPGEQVELLGGRATADELTWWYIRYTQPNGLALDGWIAEATASGVQILGQ